MSPDARYARRVLADVVRDIGPPPAPVRFRVKQLPGNLFGECWKRADGSCFLIFLQQGMGRDMLLDTIVHELAHAYAWQGWEYRNDHDATWGVAYAQVYCAAFRTC